MTAVSRLALIAVIAALAGPIGASAQTSDGSTALAGTWDGKLGGALRLILRVTRADDGLLLGSMQSPDQGVGSLALSRIEVKDGRVTFAVDSVGGSFEGRLGGSPPALTGSWTQQGRSLPLTLIRRADTDASSVPIRPAASADPDASPVTLRVLTAPVPFLVDGRTVLVYEVNIVNPSAQDVLVTRLEVLDGTRVVASYEAATLNGMVVRPVAPPGSVDNRIIAPMTGVFAFLWLPLDAGAAAPASLTHRVTAGGRVVDGGPVSIQQGGLPIVGPPLAGADWVALNGPSNTAGHRRAAGFVDGSVRIAQRFAIDWVRVGDNFRTFSGEPLDNRSYHAYGAEALAVADAVVIGTKDGIPENVPGPTSRAVPITADTLAGNYVRLQLADGSTAMYAHFQPGSLRVKEGDRVKRGQVLGLVGNSGNSTEPHLHFHMGRGDSNWLAAEGIPYLIDAFDAAAKPGEYTPRTNELPLANTVVRFGGRR